MAEHDKYVIIGGGSAAAAAVEGIRDRDPSGTIALFSKEMRLPYDRPPLSKGLWLGKTTLAELTIHDDEYYRLRGVRVRLGCEIQEIALARKMVTDKEGSRYTYERLLIATGGTPRRLSFGEGAVRYFRTLDDYHELKEFSDRGSEFVLIGGGFIGAELAAALALLGQKVTMVFPENAILQKVLPPALAGFVTDYYRSRGVTILDGDLPTNVFRSEGSTIVQTKSGKKLTTNVALAAIGLNLHTEMAKKAGLKLDNGIAVNSFLQTSDPSVYAAGDVACFPARALEKSIRVEHWDNARAQGKHAGANMAGANKPYDYLPYFYSDLFDLGFEAVGEIDSRMQTYADWREEFKEGVIYYLDDSRVKGVLLWNVWEKVDAARNLIARKKTYGDQEELLGKI